MSDCIMPVDLQAERAALGAILLDREAIFAVGDQLQAADFYLEKHASFTTHVGLLHHQLEKRTAPAGIIESNVVATRHQL